MPTIRPKKQSQGVRRSRAWRGRPARPAPKLAARPRNASAEIGELARKRAEAEAAIAEARKSHARLREAIEHLPQGIVFLDAEAATSCGTSSTPKSTAAAPTVRPGAKLDDTLRIGVARGDYPEAAGREEDWIAERLAA